MQRSKLASTLFIQTARGVTKSRLLVPMELPDTGLDLYQARHGSRRRKNMQSLPSRMLGLLPRETGLGRDNGIPGTIDQKPKQLLGLQGEYHIFAGSENTPHRYQ